jgi:hypothetical protein
LDDFLLVGCWEFVGGNAEESMNLNGVGLILAVAAMPPPVGFVGEVSNWPEGPVRADSGVL